MQQMQQNFDFGLDCGMAKTKPAREDRAPRPAFPAPDHDHRRCSNDAMATAEAVCLERGQRLTAIRRRVLDELLASHKPLGAYEIIDRLANQGTRPAPITAYRALEFLRENGLVHRIESRNAFIACVHDHPAGEPVVFLICEHCGANFERDTGHARRGKQVHAELRRSTT
jgi:Fur family zinc uptake transcriptional regulator